MCGFCASLGLIWRHLVATSARLVRSISLIFGNSGARGSILLGVFAVGLDWFGAWYMASKDASRSETAAYHDAANLARVFEENIIRLLQAHDQILLFARSSYVKQPEQFD